MSNHNTEDLYNTTAASPTEGRYGRFTKTVDEGAPKIGRAMPAYDRRKFKYDVLAARQETPVDWHVTKDDRMEAGEAGDKLDQIHKLYGIDRENPGVIKAFDDALFFCHTINSGSVLQPGRSVITVRGTDMAFRQVVTYLGNDIRRFFRAFADEIRVVNRRVLESYDPQNIEAVERHSWLMEVASDRGLMRHPDLAHDSSDKCVLTPGERAAVSNSKVSVFGTIINAADRFNSNARMSTADDFDSTNLTTVPTKSTVGN